MIYILVALMISYLLGSLPLGVLLARRYGHFDLTQRGSGNIGATNVARVVGEKAGLLTLIGDIAKGLLPVLAFSLVIGSDNWQKQAIIALAGLASFLGHLYPIFLWFKGGKGVATSTGVFLGICPLAVLVDAILFLIVFWRWRYVSLASLSSVAAMPILIGLLSDKKLYILLGVIMACLIFYRHQENIKRLLKGIEPTFR
jgi:glycerol-3-phosphate acyltransferase PlsY